MDGARVMPRCATLNLLVRDPKKLHLPVARVGPQGRTEGSFLKQTF